jgi:mRNA-degrading endonuclease RelE of RelBE toxin-antitoxin system
MHVVITEEAEKQYKHLPKPEQTKIKKKLAVLENYAYVGKKLTGDLTRFRSLRAWPYRILYSVDEEKQEITVNSIQHRQGVYKR